MLPAEAPRVYGFAVPSRIVLWQHVGDLTSSCAATSNIMSKKESADHNSPSCIYHLLITRSQGNAYAMFLPRPNKQKSGATVSGDQENGECVKLSLIIYIMD